MYAIPFAGMDAAMKRKLDKARWAAGLSVALGGACVAWVLSNRRKRVDGTYEQAVVGSKNAQQLVSVGLLGRSAQAKGEVQKAMGQNVAIDSIWDGVAQNPDVKKEFGSMLAATTVQQEKQLAVQTLVPLLNAKYEQDPEGVAKKRAGILNGYRDAAEKNGLRWREYSDALQSRGMDVWERERKANTNPTLAIADYYVYGGQGPLHSYAEGNCNWEAAFDAKPAFELVHMHHFPTVSPEDCMAELHRRLDDATLGALKCAGPVRRVLDIGCGVGTSTFSMRKSLDRHGMKEAKLTALDLSTHFITVAKFRQQHGDQSNNKWGENALEFVHGDGLQLSALGVDNESVEVVLVAKVTHEAPTHANYMLFKEAARVLRPGGVVGYVDINPNQILKNNPVSNLVERVAIRNEPFFDQFIGLDMRDVFKKSGLEFLCEEASNPSKWPDVEDAPVTVMVARKPLSKL